MNTEQCGKNNNSGAVNKESEVSCNTTIWSTIKIEKMTSVCKCFEDYMNLLS